MAIYPDTRIGVPVTVRQSEMDFSYFPMTRGSRRWGRHSVLYSVDPWSLITAALPGQCPPNERESAEAFVRQAREFFDAAERATTFEARPLLYYYCFLNLGKAFSIARKRPNLVGTVRHGLTATLQGLGSATVQTFATGTSVNAYAELHHALTTTPLIPGTVPVSELISQTVVGHRMWADAANRYERFMAIDRLALMTNAQAKTIWAVMEIAKNRLREQRRTHENVIELGGLGGEFKLVKPPPKRGTTSFIRLEEQNVVTYNDRTADVVMKVVQQVRPMLWRTITSSRPFRRYYLYLAPTNEHRLPQLLSVYATFYYLGSLTRYQPVALAELLRGAYGPYIRELVSVQPNQWVYEMANEFRQQEVTRGAVI
jgi:hypothetical protein